jgi:ParB-like chromosome segregation protein Spo0J
VPVRVVQLSDTQVLEYQLIENAIREDVHPYEEAMAYKAMLESSEPRYDVASIAAKTGRSITHVYQRLRLAELIPDAAEVFQANQITAGDAVLIVRLLQEQQKEALAAGFREDWRTKERHAIPVRELAQWIRENLVLTLTRAIVPDLRRIASSSLSDRLIGIRDRTRLLIGFAGAFRRSELVALNRDDVEETPDGWWSRCTALRPIRTPRAERWGCPMAAIRYLFRTP